METLRTKVAALNSNNTFRGILTVTSLVLASLTTGLVGYVFIDQPRIIRPVKPSIGEPEDMSSSPDVIETDEVVIVEKVRARHSNPTTARKSVKSVSIKASAESSPPKISGVLALGQSFEVQDVVLRPRSTQSRSPSGPVLESVNTNRAPHK